jgi:hypothetical protein
MAKSADITFLKPRPGLQHPLPIARLAAKAVDIMLDAYGVPHPDNIALDETTEHISLHFAPECASYAVIAAWAELFGATLVSRPWQHDGRPVNICLAEFEYDGTAVEAFAVIPAALDAT